MTDRPAARLARLVRGSMGIIILSLAAVTFRLVLAYGVFRGSGFKPDTATFVSWAEALARFGPGGFYANMPTADYPPGFLYVLWVIGSIGAAVSGVLGGGTVSFGGDTYTLAFFVDAAILKLPAIGADVLIGLVVYATVRHWSTDRPRAEAAALGAAALYLFNPVTWYDSALWGQVDAVGTLVVLCTLVLLAEGFSEAAVASMILAGLIKPQYGVVLLPIVVLLLLRRHLFAVGTGPRPALGDGRVRGFLRDRQGAERLLTSAMAGAAMALVLLTPFGLDVPGLLQRMSVTAAAYPYLSVNAYNPWAFVGAGGLAPLALSDPTGPPFPAAVGIWSSDEVAILGPLAGVTIGAAMLAGGILIALVQLALKDSRRSLILAAAFVFLAFFILPTRVHERYAFPIFAILPLLAVGSRSFMIVTVVAALAVWINVHAVLTMPLMSTSSLTNLPFGEASRTATWTLASVAAQVFVFGYLLWHLRPTVDLIVGPIRRAVGWPTRLPDRDPYERA